MKILVFSDCHWSTTTSIVCSRGKKYYSTRIELLIAGLNWLNKLALDQKCDKMVCAGDFFDRSIVEDQELTALRDIEWNGLPCDFLVGNHESSINSGSFSSTKALESKHRSRRVINDLLVENIDENTELVYIPYIVETNRKKLSDYLVKTDKKRIIISHNDISGIQYGSFLSNTGFSIDEITNNCALYLNGHLHNSEWIVKDKILNVGSFSGHNFTNDSARYKYGVWILDTETLKLTFFENPFSLNFYKFEINKDSDVKQFEKIKDNAVLSIKCNEKYLDSCKKALENLKDKILEQRIITVREIILEESDQVIELCGTDHIAKLIQFCHEKIDNTKILDEELIEICK